MRFKTFINESEKTRKPEHTHAVMFKGNVVSYHKNSSSAYKKADALDQKHGASVHSVKLLEEVNEGILSKAVEKVKGALGLKKEDPIARMRRLNKERADRIRAAGGKPKPKAYKNPFTDTNRRDSRSEYTANREMTKEETDVKENLTLVAHKPQPFKVVRGGLRGKGKGNGIKTDTNKIAHTVNIYKESVDD